jgi:sugar O-acyltransferase (sialic acid O-acetyltransferase NeuD family)
MSRIVLFGLGRGADVAYRFLKADTEHEIVGFCVDDAHRTSDTFKGLPVCAFEEVERYFPPEQVRMFILLGYQGMNGLRAAKFAAAKAKGYTLASYVSSNIFQAEPLAIGENCFLLDGNSISLDVRIGDNVVMWSNNHVGDLTVIEDHAWLASHVTIAANARIGARAFLGIGATISNHVHIGARGFVGGHALITADTAPDSVHVFPDGGLDMPATGFMRVMMASGKL